MCVIIWKPKGVLIEKKTIAAAMAANPDGAGVAYWVSDQGRVRIKVAKGVMEPDSMMRLLAKIDTKPCAIHCRIATSGRVNQLQTHPFLITDHPEDAKQGLEFVTDSPLLFHNGVLSKLASAKYSDTVNLATMLAPLDSRQRFALLNQLGTVNKFLTLDPTGRSWRFGDWVKYRGLDCSNDYFVERPAYISLPYRQTGAGYGRNVKGYKRQVGYDTSSYATTSTTTGTPNYPATHREPYRYDPKDYLNTPGMTEQESEDWARLQANLGAL